MMRHSCECATLSGLVPAPVPFLPPHFVPCNPVRCGCCVLPTSPLCLPSCAAAAATALADEVAELPLSLASAFSSQALRGEGGREQD